MPHKCATPDCNTSIYNEKQYCGRCDCIVQQDFERGLSELVAFLAPHDAFARWELEQDGQNRAA